MKGRRPFEEEVTDAESDTVDPIALQLIAACDQITRRVEMPDEDRPKEIASLAIQAIFTNMVKSPQGIVDMAEACVKIGALSLLIYAEGTKARDGIQRRLDEWVADCFERTVLH